MSMSVIFAVIFALLSALPTTASELILEHTAIEKTLKRDVYNGKGNRYHLVEPSTCSYSYLENPQVNIAAGRMRIKSHFVSQVASKVGNECEGASDEFDVTVSGRPVYRNEKLVMEDVRLDDATNALWRNVLEVFIKSAGPRVLEVNLKEAIQRMFKDATTPYEVNIDKLVVTKLVAEDNKIRATFDFVLQAR